MSFSPRMGVLAAARAGTVITANLSPRVVGSAFPSTVGNTDLTAGGGWTEQVLGLLSFTTSGVTADTEVTDGEIGWGFSDGANERAHSWCTRSSGGTYQADGNTRTAAATLNTQSLVTEASVAGSSAGFGPGTAQLYWSPLATSHAGSASIIATLWPFDTKAGSFADASAHTEPIGDDYDLYLFTGTRSSTEDGSTLDIQSSIGVCDRSLNQACLATWANEPSNPTENAQWMSNTCAVAAIDGSSVAQTREVVALPADSFEMSAGNGNYVQYMGLKTGALEVDIRVIDLPTSGTTLVSGLPFTPVYAMIIMSPLTTVDGALATANVYSMAIAMTDFTTTKCVGAWSQNNVAAASINTKCYWSNNLVLKTHAGASLVNIGSLAATANGIDCVVTAGSAVKAILVTLG